jgi:hypothetical protein
MGEGIWPPRRMKRETSSRLIAMTGAVPRSPPNAIRSPAFFPGAGMIRTAVVFLFTIPIAISSAISAEIVSAAVSPGTATMSIPTEQTQVIASNFSSDMAPASTAAIMPASSLTGMKAPLKPPT